MLLGLCWGRKAVGAESIRKMVWKATWSLLSKQRYLSAKDRRSLNNIHSKTDIMEKYRNFVTSFYVIPIIYRIKLSFNLSVMKRSILIVFGLMLTALNVWSNDYNYLVFVTNTGPRSIAVEDLEMTVSDGKLVVRSGANGETFDLSTLTKMYFSDAAVVSINDVEAGKVQSVSIHDLSGRLVGCYPSLDVARESLPKGVYVAKQGNKNFKLAKR